MRNQATLFAFCFLLAVVVVACTPQGPNNPPGVAIAIPKDGTTFTVEQHGEGAVVEVQAVGVAIDHEDGVLPDASLTWSTQKVGSTTWETAGHGQQVTLHLANTETVGANMSTQYKIRLAAVDSNGNTNEAMVTVTLVLPL